MSTWTGSPPKALLTDVFGTVVDWRSSVTDHLSSSASAALNDATASLPSTVRARASTISWPDFAQAWRVAYYNFTRSYDPDSHNGQFPTIDKFFRSSLEDLTHQYSIAGLWTPSQLDSISRIWQQLTPWPDSGPGLDILTTSGFITATLSNGNTSLLSALASFGHLNYSTILSAQDFGAYKPNPRVYNGAAEKLGLAVSKCAMVAAHLADLEGARRCGMRTIYIDRPQEESWDEGKARKAQEEGWVDMWVSQGEGGFEEVARRLGVGGKL